MAKRDVVVSDLSGAVIEDGEGVVIRVEDYPELRQTLVLDVSRVEARGLFGSASGGKVERRKGRTPKSLVDALQGRARETVSA